MKGRKLGGLAVFLLLACLTSCGNSDDTRLPLSQADLQTFQVVSQKVGSEKGDMRIIKVVDVPRGSYILYLVGTDTEGISYSAKDLQGKVYVTQAVRWGVNDDPISIGVLGAENPGSDDVSVVCGIVRDQDIEEVEIIFQNDERVSRSVTAERGFIIPRKGATTQFKKLVARKGSGIVLWVLEPGKNWTPGL